ncbi:MAG TPA: DNA-formamidopyrimidine glycosylase family protein, partial [Candidatus Cybelea sp.]
MPELPEVETIVRGLCSNVVGKEIAAVEVRLPKIAVAPTPGTFARELPGECITGVHRRGKYAVLELTSGRSLVTSLRMTGRLVVQRDGEPDFPGTHVVLNFTDGTRLSFADVRTFGRMRLVEPGEAWDRDLGIEPLSADFTAEAVAGMLSGRTTPVKVFLLDQRRIAGIGNIYACEALWEAGIRPSRPVKSLT